jgi:hypothetical protein
LTSSDNRPVFVNGVEGRPLRTTHLVDFYYRDHHSREFIMGMDAVYILRKRKKRVMEAFAMHWFVKPERRAASINVLPRHPESLIDELLTGRFDWSPSSPEFFRIRLYDTLYSKRKALKMTHTPFLERIAVEVSV